jgi:hypothetical protein
MCYDVSMSTSEPDPESGQVVSAEDNLLGMEIDFCAYLGDPAYREGV